MDVQTFGPADVHEAALRSDTASGVPAAGHVPTIAAPPARLPQFSLPQDVAKLFAGSAAGNVQVSFQVAHYPNEIVTVFKDGETGEVLSQVPSEIMLKIAEFFDQVAGVVLDKHA